MSFWQSDVNWKERHLYSKRQEEAESDDVLLSWL
jgi:hypothetical protein